MVFAVGRGSRPTSMVFAIRRGAWAVKYGCSHSGGGSRPKSMVFHSREEGMVRDAERWLAMVSEAQNCLEMSGDFLYWICLGIHGKRVFSSFA